MESLSVRSDDDPDSEALKQGLKLLFIRPTLLALGWLVCAFFAHGLFKIMAFWTIGWVAANCMFRPSKFGPEIGLAIDAGLQFLKACNALMAKHIAPFFAKANAAHHKQRRARGAPSTAAQAFVSAERLAHPAAERTPEVADIAMIEPIVPPAPSPKAKTDWLAVLKRWWWIAPAVLLALFAIGVVNWAKGLLDGPSAREIVADVRTNQAEAETRTANAENEQLASALRRVEEAAARLDQIEREAEAAREAIRNAPTDDAAFVEHDTYVDGVRHESAGHRSRALSDLRSTIDP